MAGILKFFDNLFGGIGKTAEGLGNLVEWAPELIVFSGLVLAFSAYEDKPLATTTEEVVQEPAAPPA